MKFVLGTNMGIGHTLSGFVILCVYVLADFVFNHHNSLDYDGLSGPAAIQVFQLNSSICDIVVFNRLVVDKSK